MTADTALRFPRDDTLLLVVDIQQRLAPQVAGHAALIGRTLALLDAAALFGVPALATEHCADRIGPLLDPVRARFADGEVVTKTCFGAADHPEFVARVQATGRGRIVLAGMEAHVCVMQTALGLQALGFQTGVVVDAAGSRAARALDRDLALQRMQQAGCALLGTETLLFEWCGRGDDPHFRDVLRAVKALPN